MWRLALPSFRFRPIAVSLRWACTSTTKQPPWSRFKPIAEVLRECRPLDTEEDFKLYHDKLEPFKIRTARNWLELSDEDKRLIHAAGLPEAVINDLNDAVR